MQRKSVIVVLSFLIVSFNVALLTFMQLHAMFELFIYHLPGQKGIWMIYLSYTFIYRGYIYHKEFFWNKRIFLTEFVTLGKNPPFFELSRWLWQMSTCKDFWYMCIGTIFILRKDRGGGWSRKWQFSLTLCNENVLT